MRFSQCTAARLPGQAGIVYQTIDGRYALSLGGAAYRRFPQQAGTRLFLT